MFDAGLPTAISGAAKELHSFGDPESGYPASRRGCLCDGRRGKDFLHGELVTGKAAGAERGKRACAAAHFREGAWQAWPFQEWRLEKACMEFTKSSIKVRTCPLLSEE